MIDPSTSNRAGSTDTDRETATRQRYAAIDIGTNSVKIWVADCSGDEFPDTVHEEIEITKLGQDLGQTGSLTDDAITRTLDTAKRFVHIARDLEVQELTIAATSAVRQARNQETFLSRAREELQQDVQVISGEREAELTFAGVTHGRGHEADDISVFDVGGGSTEFIHGDLAGDIHQKSVPVGSVQLYERLGWNGPLSDAELETGIERTRDVIQDHISNENLAQYARSAQLIGVGGTIATIAQVHLGLPEFSKSKIEGCRISRSDIMKTSEEIFRHSPQDRVDQLHVKPGRSEYIAGGAAVVNGVLDVLSASELQATCRGLRHGLLIDAFRSKESDQE